MKKNWIFILLLSMAALSLAGTAAYFSVYGLTKLFAAAGIGITILAASLEFAKLVTVSYVYRFWKIIKRGLRGFYVFAVVFIMFLTSIGIYGFLTGAYQQSVNKLQLRDAQISISENKKALFVNQLNRINESIKSSSERINTLSGLRTQQENRLDNLYNQKYVSVAQRTESQINGSDDQIRILNSDITDKMRQTSSINDSIAFYDQKIALLKSSDVSNEIGPYKFVADLTGISIDRIVNVVAILIILVFDPLAIALLIGVNQLTMAESPIYQESKINNFFKKRKKDEETITTTTTEPVTTTTTEPITTTTTEPVTTTEPITTTTTTEPITTTTTTEPITTTTTTEPVTTTTTEPITTTTTEPVTTTEPITTTTTTEPITTTTEIPTTIIESSTTLLETVIEPIVIEPIIDDSVKSFLDVFEPADEFEAKKVDFVTKGRINVAHFVPKI